MNKIRVNVAALNSIRGQLDTFRRRLDNCQADLNHCIDECESLDSSRELSYASYRLRRQRNNLDDVVEMVSKLSSALGVIGEKFSETESNLQQLVGMAGNAALNGGISMPGMANSYMASANTDYIMRSCTTQLTGSRPVRTGSATAISFTAIAAELGATCADEQLYLPDWL